jgi:hypothetical protein
MQMKAFLQSRMTDKSVGEGKVPALPLSGVHERQRSFFLSVSPQSVRAKGAALGCADFTRVNND